MRKLAFAILLISLPVLLFGQPEKGYLIDVSIRGLRDSDIYLAYHFGDKQYITDTVKLDKSGKTRFTGEKPMEQGIYLVVLPGKKYFEMLLSDDQTFSVECSWEDYANTLKFNGSPENTAFLDYQRNWVKLQQKAAAVNKRLQASRSNNDSVKVLAPMQKKQEEDMKAFLRNVVAANGNNLLAVLVRSLIPLELPDFKVPSAVKNPDSVRSVMSYIYNKNHFFDNVDLKDERLLRTPILQARLDAFFNNVVIPAPDSINHEIDLLVKKVEGNYKLFQFISVYLFNHFRESEIMGHDAVMVKLADDIYLSGKADWVTKEFKDDLRKQIELIRPNLIGKQAHNLIMNSYKGIYVALDDVEKDFTILYFWEPSCGHCQEATPKLKAFYDKPKDYSLEVFAVCTTGEKEKWTKYIEDNKLMWINGWDPQRLTRFDYYYNVQATPLVYILDKNKKIIAKKLSVEEIGSFIDNYRRYAGK